MSDPHQCMYCDRFCECGASVDPVNEDQIANWDECLGCGRSECPGNDDDFEEYDCDDGDDE